MPDADTPNVGPWLGFGREQGCPADTVSVSYVGYGLLADSRDPSLCGMRAQQNCYSGMLKGEGSKGRRQLETP